MGGVPSPSAVLYRQEKHQAAGEGISCHYRYGMGRRDRSEQFGLWQGGWKRHQIGSADGVWSRVLAGPLIEVQKADLVDGAVSGR